MHNLSCDNEFYFFPPVNNLYLFARELKLVLVAKNFALSRGKEFCSLTEKEIKGDSEITYCWIFSMLFLFYVFFLYRMMIFRDVERQIHPQRVISRVVYDLDLLLRENSDDADDSPVGTTEDDIKPGNAQKANGCR